MRLSREFKDVILAIGCVVLAVAILAFLVEYGTRIPRKIEIETETFVLKELNRIDARKTYYKCANCEKVYLMQGYD